MTSRLDVCDPRAPCKPPPQNPPRTYEWHLRRLLKVSQVSEPSVLNNRVAVAFARLEASSGCFFNSSSVSPLATGWRRAVRLCCAQVILLLLMLFMRKRVALAIALFHVAGKVFIHLPLLTLQPFVTFLVLLLFWLYWVLVLLFLGTSGKRQTLPKPARSGIRPTRILLVHILGSVRVHGFNLRLDPQTFGLF